MEGLDLWKPPWCHLGLHLLFFLPLLLCVPISSGLSFSPCCPCIYLSVQPLHPRLTRAFCIEHPSDPVTHPHKHTTAPRDNNTAGLPARGWAPMEDWYAHTVKASHGASMHLAPSRCWELLLIAGIDLSFQMHFLLIKQSPPSFRKLSPLPKSSTGFLLHTWAWPSSACKGIYPPFSMQQNPHFRSLF